MPKQFLLIFFCLATALSVFSQTPTIQPGVSHELAIWRAAHYSDVRYELNLTLEKMSPVLKGTIEIRVVVSALPRGNSGPGGLQKSEPGAVATGFPIVLDWRKIRGNEKLSTIFNVSVNGEAVKNPVAIAPGSDPEHLIFRDGVVEGENVIKLDFTSPILTSGSAITRYVDKEDGAEYIYSLFVPSDASTAFPVFDQPDLKARFTLHVHNQISGWSVISNARQDLRTDNFDVNDFPETEPISTYVFAFAAGPFAEFGDPESGSKYLSAETRELVKKRLDEDVSIIMNGADESNFIPDKPEKSAAKTNFTTFYVRKSQAAKFKPHAAEVFRLTREGVKYLETYFDYKFPFPKYDIVLIPEFPFGGMEHAGATFLRESSVIFPSEPTKNDFISRATLIFHETAHQWFGDTVTMRWFDDLWLKEGFATFMGYKALEKIMPETNAWKVFYERVKQGAYATDSTKGTTPIYQPIENLSAAKSAYGNIVYNKAPAFLRQAEFYLGEDKFQTAVRAFLKKHEYANAGWEDLVKEFEAASGKELKDWADRWIKTRGGPVVTASILPYKTRDASQEEIRLEQYSAPSTGWSFKTIIFWRDETGNEHQANVTSEKAGTVYIKERSNLILFAFPNYSDYGYGIFLLDDKSRDYVLKNIQNEKDPFLRSMMWGALWDSVREGELNPKEYVELVVKNVEANDARVQGKIEPTQNLPISGNIDFKIKISSERDESTIATLLARVSTAMNYYLPAEQAGPPASAGMFMQKPALNTQRPSQTLPNGRASAIDDLRTRLETLLIDRMQTPRRLGSG